MKLITLKGNVLIIIVMNNLRIFFRMWAAGVRNMSKLGRRLWLIAIIKLVIMFAVLKLFFFPNYLNQHCDTPEEKGDFVIERLTDID